MTCECVKANNCDSEHSSPEEVSLSQWYDSFNPSVTLRAWADPQGRPITTVGEVDSQPAHVATWRV